MTTIRLRRTRTRGSLEALAPNGRWVDWRSTALPADQRAWLDADEDHGIVSSGRAFPDTEIEMTP